MDSLCHARMIPCHAENTPISENTPGRFSHRNYSAIVYWHTKNTGIFSVVLTKPLRDFFFVCVFLVCFLGECREYECFRRIIPRQGHFITELTDVSPKETTPNMPTSAYNCLSCSSRAAFSVFLLYPSSLSVCYCSVPEEDIIVETVAYFLSLIRSSSSVGEHVSWLLFHTPIMPK